MLQLTKRTEYGLLALVHLVDRAGEFISVREICERYPLPKRHGRRGAEGPPACGQLVDSQRGSDRRLHARARSPESITLGPRRRRPRGCAVPDDLRVADRAEERRLRGPARPARFARPIHRVRERLWQMLEHTTLRSLVVQPPLRSPVRRTRDSPRTPTPTNEAPDLHGLPSHHARRSARARGHVALLHRTFGNAASRNHAVTAGKRKRPSRRRAGRSPS
jgi:DNA-binding IscR family transcriptional regulator